MAQQISDTVGRGVSSTGKSARNFPEDVETIQELLNLVQPGAGGPHPALTITGKVDDRTYEAIGRFQQRQFGWKDGVVDPDKITLRRLNEIVDRHWPPNRDEILNGDKELATRVARNCFQRLAGNPSQNTFLSELLQDTFDIDGSDDDEVQVIRNRFGSVEGRLKDVKITFTDANGGTRERMGYPAFVNFSGLPSRPPNEIFITHGYFGNGNPLDRAITLIHEHIHLSNTAAGHPGNGGEEFTPVLFGRDRIGVDFGHAAVNPYCYEYFAKWLWLHLKRPTPATVP
jgi:hypothetical protein